MSIRVRGSGIKTLPGLATRPTPSRVREAIFNIWQGKIAGCRWLDLCAGSGAMSAEALVRGASTVVGIEQSGAACKLIEQNWQKMIEPDRNPAQSYKIYRGDVVKTLPKLKSTLKTDRFDLIYFDPPYQSDLYEPVLNLVPPLMADRAILAAEHDRSRTLPAETKDLVLIDRRIYGQTSIAFYQLKISE